MRSYGGPGSVSTSGKSAKCSSEAGRDLAAPSCSFYLVIFMLIVHSSDLKKKKLKKIGS